MKKNLISVIILALVLANLILTAVLTISILPQTKKSNELIDKVCAAIDLDLEGGTLETISTIPLEQIVTYNVNGGENMTINLKPGEDGVQHYAIIQVALGMDSKDEGYKTYGTAEQLADKEMMIKTLIQDVVSRHTVDEMRADQGAVQDEVLAELRTRYNSNFIVSVSFVATYN